MQRRGRGAPDGRRARSDGRGVLLAGMLAAVALVAGCGEERSARRFCEELDAGLARIDETLADRNERYEGTDDLGEQLLNAFGGVVELQEDVLALYRSLADAAPEEIRGDAERLAELYEEQMDVDLDLSATGVLTAIGEAVVDGTRTYEVLQRVDDYAVHECGTSLRAIGTG